MSNLNTNSVSQPQESDIVPKIEGKQYLSALTSPMIFPRLTTGPTRPFNLMPTKPTPARNFIPEPKRKAMPGKRWYWCTERIKEAITQVVVGSGQKLFPTDREIRRAGYGSVLQRFWKTKGLREQIAHSLGLELRAVTKTHLKTQKKTQRWTLPHAKKVILELVAGNNGTMPTQAWFNENGFGGLNAWICKKYGGVTNFTKLLADEGADIKLRRQKRRRKRNPSFHAPTKRSRPSTRVKLKTEPGLLKKDVPMTVLLERMTKLEDIESAMPCVPVPTAMIRDSPLLQAHVSPLLSVAMQAGSNGMGIINLFGGVNSEEQHNKTGREGGQEATELDYMAEKRTSGNSCWRINSNLCSPILATAPPPSLPFVGPSRSNSDFNWASWVGRFPAPTNLFQAAGWQTPVMNGLQAPGLRPGAET